MSTGGVVFRTGTVCALFDLWTCYEDMPSAFQC